MLSDLGANFLLVVFFLFFFALKMSCCLIMETRGLTWRNPAMFNFKEKIKEKSNSQRNIYGMLQFREILIQRCTVCMRCMANT